MFKESGVQNRINEHKHLKVEIGMNDAVVINQR